MEMTGGWEHRWKWTCSEDDASRAALNNGPGAADNNARLQGQLDAMRTQVRTLQSQRDQAKQPGQGMKRMHDDGGKNGGGKRNKGGKGKGKGKDKYGKW